MDSLPHRHECNDKVQLTPDGCTSCQGTNAHQGLLEGARQVREILQVHFPSLMLLHCLMLHSRPKKATAEQAHEVTPLQLSISGAGAYQLGEPL